MKRSTVLHAALWAWVAATLVATLAPLPADMYDLTAATATDKIVHVVLFGGLGALCYLNRWPRAGWRWATGTGIIAAALIEVVQSPLVYRSGDVWDFAAGSAGAAVAAGAAMLAAPYRPSST